MTWHYRVAYQDTTYPDGSTERVYGVVEYFPDVLGHAAWSADFEEATGESVEDLRGSLQQMLKDIDSCGEPFDIDRETE